MKSRQEEGAVYGAGGSRFANIHKFDGAAPIELPEDGYFTGAQRAGAVKPDGQGRLGHDERLEFGFIAQPRPICPSVRITIMTIHSIAVVGAGMAGLACARRLTKTHPHVRVFDKGRSPGGRLSTRRVETPVGPVQFDHGAQYLTARDPSFVGFLEDMIADGAVAAWDFDDISERSTRSAAWTERRWVGTPGMSTIARRMAADIDVATSLRCLGAHMEVGGWYLDLERVGSAELLTEGPFDAIVFALPAEQVAPLLASIEPAQAMEAAAAKTGPCWAGLFAFDRLFDVPFKAARTEGPLSWVARENSKPGRSGPEAWVVHASHSWSRAAMECTPAEVVELLWLAFRDLAPAAPEPVWRQAHRWRYAMVETPAPSPFSWDAALGLGTCGDWRIGPRVEAAWLSGDRLGAAISG